MDHATYFGDIKQEFLNQKSTICSVLLTLLGVNYKSQNLAENNIFDMTGEGRDRGGTSNILHQLRTLAPTGFSGST